MTKRKRYLVNEHQMHIIGENIMKEVPEEYIKGDQIVLQSPIEGFNVPVNSKGIVIHVDAIGTVRTEFNTNGQRIVVPVNPDVDKIAKIGTQQPLSL